MLRPAAVKRALASVSPSRVTVTFLIRRMPAISHEIRVINRRLEWRLERNSMRLIQNVLAFIVSFCAACALAQPYPSKPIRFVVGFPPGGSADPTTRILGAALAEQMGQPVVVENRPGADSALAAEQVTRLPADGYTIFFGSNSAMTAAVALRKTPLYDPVADFSQISMVGRATVILYSHPSVPGRTLAEFIAYAKANPGKLNYGTGNPLSILYNVQLMQAKGIDMHHVPYKGEGPLMPDII